MCTTTIIYLLKACLIIYFSNYEFQHEKVLGSETFILVSKENPHSSKQTSEIMSYCGSVRIGWGGEKVMEKCEGVYFS